MYSYEDRIKHSKADIAQRLLLARPCRSSRPKADTEDLNQMPPKPTVTIPSQVISSL